MDEKDRLASSEVSSKREILEFKIDNVYYGIDIGRVKEILNVQSLTPLPRSDDRIEGIFILRETVYTVINLARIFNKSEEANELYERFIVLKIGDMTIAFHVHEISGMSLIDVDNIKLPDKSVAGSANSLVKEIAHDKDKLVLLLDYDKIVSDMNPEYEG
ncbi:MAG: chemotaxis protein CheW [Lachnospiraceae bacterium]|nr:chemotaxis protein CheW [Lachnospiraceae bacterium]